MMLHRATDANVAEKRNTKQITQLLVILPGLLSNRFPFFDTAACSLLEQQLTPCGLGVVEPITYWTFNLSRHERLQIYTQWNGFSFSVFLYRFYGFFGYPPGVTFRRLLVGGPAAAWAPIDSACCPRNTAKDGVCPNHRHRHDKRFHLPLAL